MTPYRVRSGFAPPQRDEEAPDPKTIISQEREILEGLIAELAKKRGDDWQPAASINSPWGMGMAPWRRPPTHAEAGELRETIAHLNTLGGLIAGTASNIRAEKAKRLLSPDDVRTLDELLASLDSAQATVLNGIADCHGALNNPDDIAWRGTKDNVDRVISRLGNVMDLARQALASLSQFPPLGRQELSDVEGFIEEVAAKADPDAGTW